MDLGAGTGCATIAAARRADRVFAIGAYQSILDYGKRIADEAGLANITHLRADRSSLPLDDASFDAVWAELDHREAHRIVAPLSRQCAPVTGGFRRSCADS